VSLAGDHQVRNARVAVLAAERLRHHSGFGRISRKSVRAGLGSIRKLSGLHGRFETIRTHPTIVADVAHNPDGVRALISSTERLVAGSRIVVFGVMEDKDYRSMIDALAPGARMLLCVQPHTDRALKTGKIVEHGHARGLKCIDAGTVADGVRMAIREAREGETVLVTGSHYVVGEALNILHTRV
jgi:dihydrofolate synthase/folylpolyglutamate synthase